MACRWHNLLREDGHWRLPRRLISLAVNSSSWGNNSTSISCPLNPSSIRSVCNAQSSSAKPNQFGGSTSQVPSQRTDASRDYPLTQLFRKFMKSGEHQKAAHLLDEMGSLDSPATVVVCNSLLNSCSITRNPEMAKDVWSIMRAQGVEMNRVSYGCMLSALTRGGLLEEAVDLLHLLSEKKEANVVMYNTVLNGCIHQKSRTYAARCMQLMEAQGVAKDEVTYIELVKLSGVRGDLDSVKKQWGRLLKNVTPTPLARLQYIIALSRMIALTEARRELEHMVADLGLQSELLQFVSSEKGVPDWDQKGEAETVLSQVQGQATERQRGAEPIGSKQAERSAASDVAPILKEVPPGEGFRVDSSSLDESRDKAPPWTERYTVEGQFSIPSEKALADDPILTALQSLGCTRPPKNASASFHTLQNAYNAIINAAGKAGDHVLAETLFTEMKGLGLKTDIYTYNALLRAVVEGRGVQHGLRIVRRMEASGLRPDVHSFTALLDGYCKAEQLDQAEDLLTYMEQGEPSQRPTRYTFNILLQACAAADDLLRALQLFARMKETGVPPDSCTFLTLLSACGNASAGVSESSHNLGSGREVVKRVTAVEMDMAQCGVPHTRQSLTSVMRVLGAEGLTEAVLRRLQDANDHGKKSLLDAPAFNTVIVSCLNDKQLETGWDVYHQMKSSGVKPDVYTYNILINGCAQDKNVATAFELLDTMQQAGLAPNTITFNSLLKVVCHSGDLEKTLDLLKEMTASRVQADAATFNTILTSASYHRRLDVTEHMIEEMRRRHVSPDQDTLLPVVSTYMSAGRIDDAAEALKALSLRILESNPNNKTAAAAAEQSELNDESVGKKGTMSSSRQNQDRAEDMARRMMMNADLQDDTTTRELLMNAVYSSKSSRALAMYTAALTQYVCGSDDNSSEHERQSSWAARLSTQYDNRKKKKGVSAPRPSL